MKFYTKDITKTNLTLQEKTLWLVLLSYADNSTFQCYPSHQTLSKDCSMCVNTVKKAIKSLRDKNIIQIQQRFKEDGGKTSNLYTLLPKKMWDKSVFCEKEEIEPNQSNEDKETLEEPLHETDTKTTVKSQEIAEVSTEAIEQAKEQINYYSIVSEHTEDTPIIDVMVEVIAENQMQNITESMCVHILGRIQGKKPKNLKAYLKTLLLNQQQEEQADLWKDKQGQRQDQRQLASPNNRFHNFYQRTYDYDELDAKILNRDIAQVDSNDFNENDILSMFSYDMPF